MWCVSGVHPLHIAVKREFGECISYLMTYELPMQKVKDEVAWAVQYDLSTSVLCLLGAGAPHGLRVLTPWTATIPRAVSSWDFSVPLGYYMVMRGWRVASLQSVISMGWSTLQSSVANATSEPVLKEALEAVQTADATALADKSKPYQASLLHLAVYSGSLALVRELLTRDPSILAPTAVDFFKRTPLMYAACADKVAILRALIESKGDVNAADVAGRTALHIAAAMGHVRAPPYYPRNPAARAAHTACMLLLLLLLLRFYRAHVGAHARVVSPLRVLLSTDGLGIDTPRLRRRLRAGGYPHEHARPLRGHGGTRRRDARAAQPTGRHRRATDAQR